MNSMHNKTGLSFLTGALTWLISSTAMAAPGTVADTPLFLSNTVEPNIMLLVDDSGSMGWEGMLNQGTSHPGQTFSVSGNANITDFNPVDSSNTAVNRFLRRMYCRAYNVLAYDPNITYTPWTGHDNSNSPYPDMTLSAARTDPNDPSSTVDISNHHYWVWNDADADGEYDGPASAGPTANADSSEECGDVSSNADGVTVSSLPATEQTNYANWYTYYRNREYVAKSAFGAVIATANNVRMGLATLHNNNSVNTAITSMNQDYASGNKRALLDALYDINSSGGTPLRRTLEDAGEYLSCQTNGFGFGCPALPSGSGGECQQNFSLLMTDGFWNGNAPSVGNADGDNDSSFDGGSYADSYSNTLADVAMHFYETDIRPAVDNKVPTKTGVDENDAQHMVTYTIAFGVDGTLTSMPSDPAQAFNWPQPSADDPTTIDDLQHAAWNGRGKYLNAGDPDTLRQSLDDAISSISSRTGSAASVAFNSGTLSTNTQVYLALFNSEDWSGDIRAFDLDPNTGKVDSPSWGTDPNTGDPIGAADILDAASVSTRTILTYDGADGIPLQWSDLTATQKSDFRTNPSGGTDNEATGMARLGHLRGDRGCESGSTATCSYDDGTNTYTTRGLRPRGSRLGDIVHSSPVFVGEPELNWPDTAPFPDSSGSTYSDFKLNKANRTGVLYVGGNDGLLHAFRASDGAEIMAYAPNALFSTNTTEGYHYLADPAYSHRYYVDLTPAIADAYVKTTSSASSASWHTVLVGGLRAGGRGLFALDITDPNTFSEASGAPANTVMWEFTNADDPNLGLTFSKPSIVPLEGPSGSIRWAAIFGNGYNADGDPGSTGTAQLFIVFLEGGLDGTWSVGSDYITIDTEAGSIANQDCSDPGSDCNGLATPAVIDSNGDGLADRAYAGDLKGNLWAFDLSGSNTGQWSVAYKSGSSPVALFQSQANQPITVSPTIIRNPDMGTVSSNHPNTLVLFGTGQYLTTGDITNTDSQSFYAIWDAGNDLPNSNQLPLDYNDLIEQTIGTGASSSGVTGRTLSDNTVDYSGNPPDYGWYMDLPEAGERVTTDPVIRGDLVFFNTITPDTDICASGGTSWLMIAKTSNGGRPDKVAFDLNGDGKLDALDEIGGDAAAGKQVQGLATSPVNLGDKRYVATTETDDGDKIETDDIEKISNDNTGRLSWEEVTIE